MSSEITCPFCMSRGPDLARRDLFTFARTGTWEIYPCPCGGVATPLPFEKGGVGERGREVVRAFCTASLDASPEDCDVLVDEVPNAEPPVHLLWAKRR